MKVFWAIIVALVIATGVLFATREQRADAPAPELAASSEPEAQARVDPLSEPEAPASDVTTPGHAATAGAETSTGRDAPVSEPVAPAPAPSPVVEAPPAPVPEAPVTTEAQAPVSTPVIETEATPGKTLAGASESEEAKPAAEVAPEGASPAALTLFRDQFEVVPARTKPGEDGVTIYDERFPVKGTGTAEDPIEIPWEHLVSASETFQPRMGKKRIPERITMLDGKHVRVTGYVAFPIMAAAQNEMLSMRNMWDGCCIGVPPTPYDAVEVKLKAAATGKDRFTAFGTVEGVMKVDPYVKGNWLLGLYLLEEAALTQLKEGTDPGKHGGL